MTNIQIKSQIKPHKNTAQNSLLVNTRKFVEQILTKTDTQAFKNNLRDTLEKSQNSGKLLLTIQEQIQKSLGKKDYFNHQFCGLPNATKIKIVKANKGKFMYSGLSSCSMVWRCPTCSIKILSGRTQEINHLLEHHIKKGYYAGLVTLTMRHKKLDSYEYTFNKLNDTYRKIRQHKEFRNLVKQNFYLGQIKSLETTFSQNNGWHPHIHVIYLYKTNDKKIIQSFQKSLISKWATITNSQVKRQSEDIIKTLNEVGQYITKFDIVNELTCDWNKNSQGIKPFQMLEAIASKKIVLGTKTVEQSKRLLTNLWIEYITTTKGKHRISISPEINYAYKLETKSDEQLTKQIDIEDIILTMSPQIMQSVISNTIKAELINICHNYPNLIEKQREEIIKQIQEIEYIYVSYSEDGTPYLTLNQNN